MWNSSRSRSFLVDIDLGRLCEISQVRHLTYQRAALNRVRLVILHAIEICPLLQINLVFHRMVFIY